MVSLNGTLFIELALFLLFLWGTGRFILRPVLRSLDEREESIREAGAQAESNDEETMLLEEDYEGTMGQVRSWVESEFREARKETGTNIDCFAVFARRKNGSLSGQRGDFHTKPRIAA